MSLAPTAAGHGLDYLRAVLIRRPGASDAAQIPSLSRRLVAPPDPRRLARFRQLTGGANDGWLPLTYPQMLAFRGHLANLVDRRFPLALMGIVHMHSAIRCRRPLRADETLRLGCALRGLRTDERGIWFDLVTTIDEPGSEPPIYEAVATMLKPRSRREKNKDKDKQQGQRDAPPREPPASSPLDMSPPTPDAGTTLLTVDGATIRAFAVLSGDLNPIHLTGLTARLLGFRGQLAHGMWSLSRVAAQLAALTRTFGDVTLTAQFRRPIYLPARLRLVCTPQAAGREFCLTDASGTTMHLSGALRRGEA